MDEKRVVLVVVVVVVVVVEWNEKESSGYILSAAWRPTSVSPQSQICIFYPAYTLTRTDR